ncbi:hypothetical protein F4802DRAFT_561861 [Xylaria palmicola]|nr:hypothetical protein F4802DRAFT_561861 [Xylaria palmicola]
MSTMSFQNMLNYVNLGPIPWDRHLVLAAAAAGGFPLATYLVFSYRGWLALGRGGLPANPLGYLINVALHVIARTDVRAPAPYELEGLEEAYGPWARRSFFVPAGASLPERVGPRPDVPSYVAPQRQTSEPAAPRMVARMEAFLAAAVAANPGVLETRPSRLEGPSHDAMWLADGLTARPRFLKGTNGEFAHVHGEGSTHLILSLTDATRAIELFWAERHSLSGGPGGHIPWNYVLLYAPRSEEELAVWKMFITASARFVTTAAGGPPDISIPPSPWGEYVHKSQLEA